MDGRARVTKDEERVLRGNWTVMRLYRYEGWVVVFYSSFHVACVSVMSVLKYLRYEYDTMRDAILTCARKQAWVGFIYHTEPTTKKCNCKTNELKKITTDKLRSKVNSLGNPCDQSWRRKEGYIKGERVTYLLTYLPKSGRKSAEDVDRKTAKTPKLKTNDVFGSIFKRKTAESKTKRQITKLLAAILVI